MPSPSTTTSRSFSNNNEIILHNLELECHYLTRALSKLERHSPEWNYMLKRLDLANRELDDEKRRGDNVVGKRDDHDADNNEDDIIDTTTSSTSSTSVSLPTGDRYVIAFPQQRRWDNTNVARIDDEPRNQTTSTNTTYDTYYDRNGQNAEGEINNCPMSSLQENDKYYNDASFAPFVTREDDGGDTVGMTRRWRKEIRTCLRFSLLSIILITGILLVVLNVKEQTSFSSDIMDNLSVGETFAVENNVTKPCATFSLRLIPDKFGNETTWKVLHYEADDGELRDASDRNFTIVLSGGPYSFRPEPNNEEQSNNYYGAIIARACFPVGTYKFIIYDVRGDGICCEYGRGEYGINLSKGRVIHPLSSVPFSTEREAIVFFVTEDDIDVFPTASTTSSLPTTFPSSTTPSPKDASVSDTVDTTSVTYDNDMETSPLTNTDDDVYSIQNIRTALDNDTMTGRGKSYGVLFDIENSASAFSFVIKGMDLVIASTSPTHYEIWSKEGSWQDVIGKNPDYFEGFRLISNGLIEGLGASKLTEIPLNEFHDVEIQYGHRRAFWVTLSDDSMVFQNYEHEGISRHELENIVQSSREELNVFYGAAVRAYPLEVADPVTDFWYNAGFLGRIWYKESSSTNINS